VDFLGREDRKKMGEFIGLYGWAKTCIFEPEQIE
jgi:hypothetical protein